MGKLKKRVDPPSKGLVKYYNELLSNSTWERTVRDTILNKTPYVNRRSIEIVTALFCFEKAGVFGVSIQHLRFLIPKVKHSQLHRLGDFLITRVDTEIRHYRYMINPKVTIL